MVKSGMEKSRAETSDRKCWKGCMCAIFNKKSEMALLTSRHFSKDKGQRFVQKIFLLKSCIRKCLTMKKKCL